MSPDDIKSLSTFPLISHTHTHTHCAHTRPDTSKTLHVTPPPLSFLFCLLHSPFLFIFLPSSCPQFFFCSPSSPLLTLLLSDQPHPSPILSSSHPISFCTSSHLFPDISIKSPPHCPLTLPPFSPPLVLSSSLLSKITSLVCAEYFDCSVEVTQRAYSHCCLSPLSSITKPPYKCTYRDIGAHKLTPVCTSRRIRTKVQASCM